MSESIRSEDASVRETVITVTMPAMFVRNSDAARMFGMGEELFNACVRFHGYYEKAAVRGNRITLWEPAILTMLKNAIKERGLPPPKKKAASSAVQ